MARVADYGNGTAFLTLIEHWNGSAWKQVPSPNPSSTDNNLLSVAATSASNAWAVGGYENGTTSRTLIEHWNGTAWKHVSSPKLSSSYNLLLGVSATSSSDA